MKQLLILGFLSFITITARSQDPAKLLQAETYLKNNEFENAKNVYQELFTEFDDFRKKNKRKAIMGYTKAVTWWILGTDGNITDKPEELLKPYPYIINYTQYPAAKIKPDEEAKVYKQYAKALYNVAYKQLHKTQDKYVHGIPLCNAAISLDSTKYRYYDLRALLYNNSKNYNSAVADYKKAISLYELNFDTLKPDYYFPFSYYSLAYLLSGKVEESNVKNVDSAIYYIQKLRDIVEKTSLKCTEYERQEYGYEIASMKHMVEDGKRLELAIYLENPNYLKSTVSKFKDEVDKNPSDYKLRVAYAGLLAIHDTAEAIVQYKKAIELDSSQTIAYYNLAALHINIVYRISSELHDSTPTEVINETNAIADANCNLAYQLLVKAHTIGPTDVDILYQLVKLTEWLNMEAENALYKQKINQLNQ